MFLHLCVILFTGGVYLQGWGMSASGEGCLPPGGLQNPDPHWILRDTVNERAIRILLESIPVFSCDQVETKKPTITLVN